VQLEAKAYKIVIFILCVMYGMIIMLICVVSK